MKELAWPQRGRLWLRLGLRLVFAGLLVLFVWKVLPPVLSLLMPFVVALALAWLLNPAIRFLQKKLNVRRGVLSMLLVVLVIAVVGGLLAGLVYSLLAQMFSLLQNWQSVWGEFMSGVEAVAQALEDLLRPLPGETYEQAARLTEKFTGWIATLAPTLVAGLASNAGSFAMSLPSLGVGVVISIMATYFISADYPHLRFKVTQRVPEEFRGFFSQVKHVAVDAFGGYVRAEFILSVVVFFILLAGFFALGEPYTLLLAFALAVMDFIPIIGAGTVMVPWAVVDMILGHYGEAAGLMAVWGIIVLFRQVGEPKILGDQTGLSPILSLVGIYVGMKVGGILGMVLGPLLLLVCINLAKLGIFRPVLDDLALAASDISAILRSGRRADDQKTE